MPDIKTVPELAKRAKADGLPINAYTIRKLIKQGIIGLLLSGLFGKGCDGKCNM